MDDIRDTIRAELENIEKEENVRILYACESGSRAWGFASRDSDYDVRFLYLHPVEGYLSIFDKRDVIERPVSGRLDVNGWDLKKALLLFKKSNPPLLEWLQSPIVYCEQTSTAERIRELSPLSFSPKSCIYHYLNMAKGNYRDYLQSEQVRIKKYFYVLRPILACGWIEQYGSMPPMAFERLVESLIPKNGDLYENIRQLLVRKKSGIEMDLETKIAPINDYLEERIAYFEQTAAVAKAVNAEMDDELDRLFRSALRETWGKP